jgi:hypothetical protein
VAAGVKILPWGRRSRRWRWLLLQWAVRSCPKAHVVVVIIDDVKVNLCAARATLLLLLLPLLQPGAVVSLHLLHG